MTSSGTTGSDRAIAHRLGKVGPPEQGAWPEGFYDLFRRKCNLIAEECEVEFRLGRGLVFVRNEHSSATNLDDFIAGIAVMRAAIGETVR